MCNLSIHGQPSGSRKKILPSTPLYTRRPGLDAVCAQLYAKTLNIPKVQQALGHNNIRNTQLYAQLINFFCDDYDVQVAESLEEAKKLFEVGFGYVTDMDGRKLFRERK